MLIDFGYILRQLEEINAENTSGAAGKKGHVSRINRAIRMRAPGFFTDRIISPIQRFRYLYRHMDRERYIISDGDLKRWSWDFLIYCMKEQGRLAFDLGLFPEGDREEILKFVRNKLYLAYQTFAAKEKLFSKDDIMHSKEYGKMKVRWRGGHFALDGTGYKLPIRAFEPTVFFHRYGIGEMPEHAAKMIRGKDVLDCGAFVGDSALVFRSLAPRSIYAFEPDEKNFVNMLKTAELNDFRELVPIKKGVGAREGTARMLKPGTAGASITESGEQEVEITSIDRVAESGGLEAGLIKMDVEGYELEAIRGAERTIRKDRPALMISLYHRGQDFFEIPPLLKKWVPGYRFRFLNLARNLPISERVLLAYME